MILPVVTTMKEMKEVNYRKINIRVGSVVAEKARDMEENNREIIRRKTRK